MRKLGAGRREHAPEYGTGSSFIKKTMSNNTDPYAHTIVHKPMEGTSSLIE